MACSVAPIRPSCPPAKCPADTFARSPAAAGTGDIPHPVDDIAPRTVPRHRLAVQSYGDHAKRIEPALMGGGALQPDGPADGLPAHAVGAQPDDPAVDGVEPHR